MVTTTSTGYDSNNTPLDAFTVVDAPGHEIATDANKADAARDQRAPTNKQAISQVPQLFTGKFLASNRNSDSESSSDDDKGRSSDNKALGDDDNVPNADDDANDSDKDTQPDKFRVMKDPKAGDAQTKFQLDDISDDESGEAQTDDYAE